MNYQEIFDSIYQQVTTEPPCGKVASYIPELAKVDPKHFGACLRLLDTEECVVGDFNVSFSIQSISKVFTLAMIYKLKGDEIWSRIGVEPSGNAFNSLVQLEVNQGIPRNPFMNGGAIVVADMLLTELANPKAEFIEFIRQISGIETIDYCPRVAESEKRVGYRNVALCNLMKSFGNIDNEPDEVLDFYFYCCSIEMTCSELAKAAAFLADSSVNIGLSLSQVKRVNAVMQTCGFYDESGEFAFHVGLPGKSGVGGGILAVRPAQYSIVVWSPPLNEKGNSYRGMRFLEAFTTMTKSSIF